MLQNFFLSSFTDGLNKLDWLSLARFLNILDWRENLEITDVKSFYNIGPWADVVKLFSVIIYKVLC